MNNDSCPTIPRLAIVATHPIQYQVPLWRAMAGSGRFDIKVFYASDHGTTESVDPSFGKAFAWDIPLLDGYDHEFLVSSKVPGLPAPVRNRFPKGLKKRIANGEFDAVLIHGYATAAALAAYIAARKLNLPILLRGESHLEETRGFVKRTGKYFFLKNYLKGVSFCIAIGQWNEAYWRHYGMPNSRIRRSVYAVDNDRFQQTADDQKDSVQRLRAQWNVDPDNAVFLYAGKLITRKGVDTLLEAFARLRKMQPAAHLVLVGSGAEEQKLKRQAEGIENIHWAGFVNQKDLPLYYRAADICILPSRVEAWGLVVNEAMACGTPCIVSDAVGCGPDLVSKPGTGLVIPVGDSTALADAMRQACNTECRIKWQKLIPPVLEGASYSNNARVIADCLHELSVG